MYEELKTKITHLLLNLYYQYTQADTLNYDDVDGFYGHLGYDLESEALLHQLNIHGTSDLYEQLKRHEAAL